MPRRSFLRLACRWILAASLATSFAPAPLAQAQDARAAAGEAANPQRGSGLPLPRFVSLRSGRVNSRIGPGLSYPVDWLYLKPGLPMEIIQEYDNWRRVRDPDGAEGWINQALLSGKRTAIVAPWQRGKEMRVSLLEKPKPEAVAIAFVEPGAVGAIESCDGEWCRMTFRDPDSGTHAGFVPQSQVWGAYPGETVED